MPSRQPGFVPPETLPDRNMPEHRAGTLGTFAGVFTPSILTILGIILFLRLGYVVGQAGLGQALVILCLANCISLITTVSLSAIATNMKVKGGGDYYLISRTLGMAFGGAIGLVLFIAQSVSIAFYCMGFGEVIAGMVSSGSVFSAQLIAATAVAGLFGFAWLGADWANRFQFVVMGILTGALISFAWGGVASWNPDLLVANWSKTATGPGFWVLFAIFFPAVTGFTQGVSMSGDLKDPGKSLPQGTFLAVGVSVLVYFSAAVLFSGALPGHVLRADYSAMKQVAVLEWLVTAGVIAATLSSAMASFLGAPRILQSLAGDRIFGLLRPFARGHGPANNPRRGVLLSGAIAMGTIALGNLNLVASVVSMFFLISYGLLNYATYYEAYSGSPSFRPRFRFYNKYVSLAGAFACLAAMLAIDLASGVVAISVLFSVYQYVSHMAGPSRWADSRRSHYLQRIRESLLAVAAEPDHPRDWRPNILAFSNDFHRRARLLKFSEWIEGGTGLTTAVRILEGQGIQMVRLRAEAEKELQKTIRQLKATAFPLVITAPTINVGISNLIQSFGVGPLRANTILVNWMEPKRSKRSVFEELFFGANLRAAFRWGCNILVLSADSDVWARLENTPAHQRRIDIWWWGGSSGTLMLILAHLVQRAADWEDAALRVIGVSDENNSDAFLDILNSTLDNARIPAELSVVTTPDLRTVAEHSADAGLVFFPMRLKGRQPADPFGHSLDELLDLLPVTVMVLAAEHIDLDAEPEDGEAAEIAAAMDDMADAQKRARAAENDAEAAALEAERLLDEFRRAVEDRSDPEAIDKIRTQMDRARNAAAKSARRAAKASAKSENAAKALEALGVPLQSTENAEPER